MEAHEEFWARRRKAERELERKLNRAMIPIMLPMVIATGAIAGLLFAILFFPPLPKAFIGIFMTVALVVGVAPLLFMMVKYRK